MAVTTLHKKNCIVTLLIVWSLVFSLKLSTARAQNRKEVVTFNIIGTAIMTTISSSIQGKISTPLDALKTFSWGAIGGFGFYQSRTLISNGHVKEGIVLSYLCSSVVENVSLREHPLAYVRYGVGPVEIRVATTFKKHPRTRLAFEMDIAEIPLFLYFLSKAEKIGLRDGLIYGIVNSEHINVFGFHADGVAPGRTILIIKSRAEEPNIWKHESIHVTQDIQCGTWLARPQEWIWKRPLESQKTTSLFGLNFRFGGIVLGRIGIEELWDHNKRWSEKEIISIMGNDKSKWVNEP